MKHREMEISFMLIVISVVVWFGRTLQVSASLSSIIVMKAERTLTRDTLLSLRLAASRPDLQTRLRIRSLGCEARRRGRRGGQLKSKSGLTVIPVVIGRRVTHGQPKSTDVSHRRRRYLRNIPRSDQRNVNDKAPADTLPSIYILNAAALSKLHAVQQLAADLVSYDTSRSSG